ncbi:hypothetical protein ABVK25_002475 [Lepraria finkii]|uniref:SET domain-containing protein n=1 Tax=Lepraria finkii TaxID=1340010 RepID=A0ABR4BJ36_9LECA
MDPDLELLAEISGAVEVRPSPGKGKGTFAKEFVPKGTRLISERPILRMSSNYFNDETLKKMVQNLPTTERRDFEDLHCPICQPEQALRQKYIMNHFSLSVPQIGICLQGSRINHSCLPNAYSSWNDKKDRFMIHAIADIQEGDEVTISYCDALATKDMRSKWLEVYQFSCECAACRTTDQISNSGKRFTKE